MSPLFDQKQDEGPHPFNHNKDYMEAKGRYQCLADSLYRQTKRGLVMFSCLQPEGRAASILSSRSVQQKDNLNKLV